MPRLDKEREERLTPERFNKAIDGLKELGINPSSVTDKRIDFTYKNENIQFFPYTGWHTGKTIKDGRGLKNLLKQLK